MEARTSRDDLTDVDAVSLEIFDAEVDPNLLGVDAVQAHRRDPGNPLQRPHDLALEQIVALGQVPLGGQPAFEDGRVVLAGVPVAADGDVADGVGQLAPDPVDALEHLGPSEAHFVAPVEVEADATAVRGAV